MFPGFVVVEVFCSIFFLLDMLVQVRTGVIRDARLVTLAYIALVPLRIFVADRCSRDRYKR